ncbi:Chromatin structure-remodeling complex protein BSH [Chlorella vulgaris]
MSVVQAHRAAPRELVPVQLTLGSSKGMLQDWLLWPVASTDAELLEFAEGLVRDLGVPPQFRHPVANTIRSQVAEWVANVPPAAVGPGVRRELVKLDVVLGGSLRVRDQFWWDLHSPSPSPEEFAQEMCADSGIDPCHGAALAAAIRIELGKLRRAPPTNLQLPTPRILEAAAGLGADGAGEHIAGGSGEPPLESVYADNCLRSPQDWHDWGPSLHQLSPEEERRLQQQQQLIQQRQQQQLMAQRLQQQQQQQLQQQAELDRLKQQAYMQAAAGATQQQQQQQQQGLAAPSTQQPNPPQQRQQAQPKAEDAGGRRQLRQRTGRASRWKELLRQEENDDDEEEAEESIRSIGSGSRGAKSKSAATRGAEGLVGSGSVASRDYQRAADSLLRGDAVLKQEDTEEARPGTRGGARPRQRRQPAKPAGKAVKAAAGNKRTKKSANAASQQLLTPQQQAMLSMPPPSSSSVGAPAGLLTNGLMGSGMEGGLLASSSLVPVPVGGMVPVMGQHPQQQLHEQQQLLPPGMVPQPLPPQQQAMVPQPAAGPGPPGASQQGQMLAAAIVQFARELSMGEQKIQAMLRRPPKEQVTLFRTLHQLVQQARARQQQQQQPQPQQLGEGMVLHGQLGGMGGPPPVPVPVPVPALATDMLPPMPAPLPAAPMPPPQAQPAHQFANLFSEMFD